MMSKLITYLTDDTALAAPLSFRPIFTRQRRVAAYEVLHGAADYHSVLGDLASDTVLRAYADVYQNGRLESVPLLLNLPAEPLELDAISVLPTDRFILGIVAPDRADARCRNQAIALSALHYRSALRVSHPACEGVETLLDTVDFVRISARLAGVGALSDTARAVYRRHARMMVDDVDTLQQFYSCTDVGVAWFQGDFASWAEPPRDKVVSSNQSVLIEILSSLRDGSKPLSDLEYIIAKDPSLSYRLLKVVNSAASGLPQKVSSLSRAINLLGAEELTRWIDVLLLCTTPGESAELARCSLIRARMSEILAELQGMSEPMGAFIVGLFSRLDILTGVAMDELMDRVPLVPEIKEALVAHSGPLGVLLGEVERYEAGQFDALKWLVEPSLYEVAYRHSVRWAQRMEQALDMH